MSLWFSVLGKFIKIFKILIEELKFILILKLKN